MTSRTIEQPPSRSRKWARPRWRFPRQPGKRYRAETHSEIPAATEEGPAHISRRETNSAWRRMLTAVDSVNLISTSFRAEPGVVGHFVGGDAFTPMVGLKGFRRHSNSRSRAGLIWPPALIQICSLRLSSPKCFADGFQLRFGPFSWDAFPTVKFMQALTNF